MLLLLVAQLLPLPSVHALLLDMLLRVDLVIAQALILLKAWFLGYPKNLLVKSVAVEATAGMIELAAVSELHHFVVHVLPKPFLLLVAFPG